METRHEDRESGSRSNGSGHVDETLARPNVRSRRPSVPGYVNRPCADWRYVLMFALLLIPFYPPTGFFNALVLDYSSVLLGLQIFAAIVTLFLGAVRKRLDIFSGIALAIVAVMFLSTFLNEGFGRGWIYVQCFLDWMPLAVAVLMVGYARQRHMTDFLIALLVVTGFLSICNTVSILAFPDGFNFGGREPFNFFGHKNPSIDIVLPSIVCSLLLDRRKGRRLSARSVMFAAIGCVQFLVSYSATSVIAILFFFILLALCRLPRIASLVNGFSLLGGYAVTVVLLMVVKVQELFAPILVGVLGKTTTFTLRTFVWEGVLSMMAPGHLLLGYGASVRFALFFNDYLYNNAHNFFLHVLVSGGLIGVVLYCILILLAASKMVSARVGSTVVLSAFGCLLVVGLMESLITITWPLVLALGYYGVEGERYVAGHGDHGTVRN